MAKSTIQAATSKNKSPKASAPAQTFSEALAAGEYVLKLERKESEKGLSGWGVSILIGNKEEKVFPELVPEETFLQAAEELKSIAAMVRGKQVNDGVQAQENFDEFVARMKIEARQNTPLQ
ncbi:MAG: hypothetical protein IKZ43_04515 [Acidaminococcaceae bacterium]|nr:hypothetical protein [Acidaminococcaceae bacterium]